MPDDRTGSLRSLTNASGFVLQLALEQSVRERSPTHGWKVEAREYPYRAQQHLRFADLVLGKGPFRLVLECKRHKDVSWVFLVPDAEQMNRTHAVVRWANTAPFRPPLADWADVQVKPESPESEFCIVPGQGAKDRPLLERIAAELLEASEAVADDFLQITEQSTATHLIIPVIVTTASLHVCRFDPGSTSLSSGELPADAHFQAVSFLRFRKTLAAAETPLEYEPAELRDLMHSAERTVFVITAEGLNEWLERFSMAVQPGLMPWDSARERDGSA